VPEARRRKRKIKRRNARRRRRRPKRVQPPRICRWLWPHSSRSQAAEEDQEVDSCGASTQRFCPRSPSSGGWCCKGNSQMGREMQTLCYVQDLPLQGKIASATDVITQRLNGLERVASGSHYTATQRQCAPRCRGDDDAFRDARSDEVAARGGPCKNVIQTMGKKMGEEKERQRWQGQRKDQGRPEPRKGRQRQCKEVRRKTFWEQAGSGYEGSMKPLAGSEEIARLCQACGGA